jgi:hypothetical protein
MRGRDCDALVGRGAAWSARKRDAADVSRGGRCWLSCPELSWRSLPGWFFLAAAAVA